MQVNELVTLIHSISESGVKHFAYQSGSDSVVISKLDGELSSQAPPIPKAPVLLDAAPVRVDEVEVAADARPDNGDDLFDVTAPYVGTILLNDAKTGEPVVLLGDTVKKGQLLFVIESMKLFIDVTAPVAGKISQICVNSQQAVEYGDVIMRIGMEE